MKGLSFSESMMKAWLAGNKSVTRRLMNPQPDTSHWNPEYVDTPKEWRKEICLGPGHRTYDPNMWCLFNVGDPKNAVPYTCRKPNYRPGEVVYIKETFSVEWMEIRYKDHSVKEITEDDPHFEDMIRLYDSQRGDWRSPRFMPEWASRSHALIVSVRPERVQEITDEEAINEGFVDIRFWAIDEFFKFWDVNYPGSWDRNDFVLRLELEKKP